MFSNQILPKTCSRFYCENCHYGTSKKSSYTDHLLTSKHNKSTNINQNLLKTCSDFICKNCDKKYKDKTGLWRHNKKCLINNKESINKEHTEIITPELILNIIQQNQDFKDLLLEQNKIIVEISKNNNQTINTNINNSMNNSNNKTFNLQFFLNETCKNAMNIMDFVDSIKIQLTDIESIGELGFVNGISKLIINNLKALDENMRPVHCSDQKRESLYVKDANVWNKEDSDNKKMKKAIKYVAHKNICALSLWKDKYPEYNNSESKRSDQYNCITMEAMGGAGNNDEQKAEKIVKKIAKSVLINKSNS